MIDFRDIFFSPSEFLNFPNNWNSIFIRNEYELIKDISDDYISENVLSLTQNGIIKRDVSGNEGQVAESYEKYIKIKPGDFSLNPMDLISGWADVAEVEGIISPSYYSFRNTGENTNTYFVTYILQVMYELNILYVFGKGIASHDGKGRWGISKDTILNLELKLPSKEYQDRSIEILNGLTLNLSDAKYRNKVIRDYIINLKHDLITGIEHLE
jgi:type I restriction enzyme, S subunit